jgi:hypothetical protein
MKTFFTLSLVCLMVGAPSRTAAGQALSSPNSHAGVAFTLAAPLGIGADIAVPVHEKVNVRGGFNVFSLSRDFDNDGITLAAQLKLRSVSAHLDWFPFGNGFHLSPGVMLYNGNEVNADASVPAGDAFDLGDESLISDPSNPVAGTSVVSFDRKVAPSLRVGWGNIVPRGGRRWSIPFELGVVFSSAPTAAFSLAGSLCESSGTNCRNIATDPELQTDVQNEQDQINDDLTALKVIPVISLGFSVKF